MDYVLEAAKYTGTPWLKGGRDPKVGLDCYGGVMLLARELFGKILPDFAYDLSTREEEAREIHARVAEALGRVVIPSTDGIQPADILIMEYKGEPTHMAIYLGSRYIAHVRRTVGFTLSLLDDFDGYKTVHQRIQGVYRCL